MKLTTEEIDGVLVARIEEARLDNTKAPQFKAELLRLVERQKAKNILIDLKKVEYVDSSGLGALLFGHRQAQSRSGQMKLLHVNARVNTLIKIAKLQDILERYEDETEAIRSF